MGQFDDLIPAHQQTSGAFDDLVPQAPASVAAAPPASSDAYMPTSILSPQEEKKAISDLGQSPFLDQLARNAQGLVPQSLGQAAEMAGQFVVPITRDDLQLPQKYRDMGTPPGYGPQHHTFDQFTGEDWQRFGGDMTAQVVMAAVGAKGLMHGAPADAAVRDSMAKPEPQGFTMGPDTAGPQDPFRKTTEFRQQEPAPPAAEEANVPPVPGNPLVQSDVQAKVEPVTATGEKAALNRKANSWILRNKETGEVVGETYDPKKVAVLNTKKYEAVPIVDYLHEISGYNPEKNRQTFKEFQEESKKADHPLQPEPAAATIQTPDELSTSQAQAGQRDTAPGAQPEPATVGGTGAPESAEGGSSAGGGVSTKNAYTEAQRAERGLPAATQEARRDFGTVWDEAEETHRRDPGAGSRLVEQINDGKTKAISDHDNALLLREQIAAQAEHTDAVKSVNEAATPETKARLAIARDRLQSVYDADKKAGRSQGQGLNARKMLAQEDYSLAQMEARKRAANDGQPLNARQLQDVQVLHERIAELSDRVDKLQNQRVSRAEATRQAKTEAKTAAASGKRFTDFMDEKAQAARERLISKRGRLNAGVDPTNLVDEAIIGASHIAKGLTKFSDWSAQMVKDFGERIKPFLRELWNRATSIHNENSKRFQSPEERNLASYKTRLAKDTAGVSAKIERGDFTKTQRKSIPLDPAAFKMRANLERLKNEFERGVAKDAYKHMGKADKFWQHFVGVERAMKLSSPAVFEKLGTAAAVREVMAPLESAGGYAVSKVFPKLAKGTRYGADLKTVARAEIKAKASIFTQGMKDSWENVKGKETELEAMSDKYGRQPDFWYNRIGKIHAAIKAPVKRAEFTRSLEHRMNAAVKAGEDINHPEVMDRLATESALDANRAIFQQNTVVSKFFSTLDRTSPAAGRVARFLFPVVKIPVNLFKELVTYHAGAPVAVARIGHAYLKGIETLEPAAREAIIRQLVKGSVGGAALLWGYFNSDKVHDLFKLTGPTLQHTPFAMALHEGSLIKQLEEQGAGTHFKPTEAWKEAKFALKTDIPFAYTVTSLTDTMEPDGWKKYLYGMLQSTVVPQASSFVAKELDKPTPFNPADRPEFRPLNTPWQAIQTGIPGLRQQVPIKFPKQKGSKALQSAAPMP